MCTWLSRIWCASLAIKILAGWIVDITLSLAAALHKWWQVKWVASVLETEDAQEEAVHNQEHAAPSPDCDSLGLGVGNSGHLDSQGDDRKGENTV